MLTRAWILDILTRLPLWYWPIFFWEVAAFERYYRAYRAANPVGILGIGVTPQGRIVIRLQEAGECPAHGPARLLVELLRIDAADVVGFENTGYPDVSKTKISISIRSSMC